MCKLLFRNLHVRETSVHLGHTSHQRNRKLRPRTDTLAVRHFRRANFANTHC
eukprot:COSAG02_NODE_30631_length_547_cov_3.598214_1_plen_51_part_01